MDQTTVAFYSANAGTVAARYEAVVSSLSGHFPAAFRSKSKLLDIGFGSGRDMAMLLEKGYDCYGVEPASELIAEAQAYHPELLGRLVQGALPELLPTFGGAFDGVLCSAVLMHIPAEQLPMAARSINACLRSEGRLLYSVPSKRLDVVSDDRDSNGRLFVPDHQDRIRYIFQDLGMTLVSSWINEDSMGRDAVQWKSVLMVKR